MKTYQNHTNDAFNYRERYIHNQYIIIDALQKKYSLFYRDYKMNMGWSNVKMLKKLGLELEIDKSVNMLATALKCNLTIIDHLLTSFLEFIGNDIPVLLFLDKTQIDFRAESQEVMNQLEKCGILHYSTESLIQKVDEVYNDVFLWWYSEDIKIIKKIFKDKFARNELEWIEEWIKTYKKL